MTKRGMAALLALCLLITAGWAETTAVQEQLIEAEEGEWAAMQISSLDGERSVGILGVESEPQRRTWEAFSEVFTRFVKKNWDVDFAFSDVIWSDGGWLRICDAGSIVMRVFLTDDTPEGLIRHVRVDGVWKQSAPDVQVLTAASYWAAAQYGQYGKYIMQIVFSEDHTADWFKNDPTNIWIENGYQLTYGQTEMGYPYGQISFTEELSVPARYAPLDPNGLINIQSEQTVAEIFDKLKAAAEEGPLKEYLTVPALPDTWTEQDGGRIYQVMWDDCALILYTDETGEHLRSAALSNLNFDTVSQCMHLYPLYAAAVNLDMDEITNLMSCVVGGHGTWEDMSALSPFCVINGVLVQCTSEKVGDDELPVAYICGAPEQEADD